MEGKKLRQNLASILEQTRYDAHISQREMADRLHVSKKTIQNWESGYSEPLFSQLYMWFEVLELQPQPYLLQLLYQNEFKKNTIEFSKKDVDNALIALLPSMSLEEKKEILYLFYGSHGSSPESVMELIAAHLHTPLRNRINVSEQVITNYEIAEKMGELIHSEEALPNMNNLKKATSKARDAILHRKNSYNTI